ncbi:helix-turn-helix transcriptional regulator [Mesorhizobium sp. CO1-1-7]|uniref:AraC family transcriptional regulator n=1 Tax=unclassified Mesorhizobium TaxID=325217 RepID=UPI001CCEDD8B|nr:MULTISPECIES: AraC family transcriptional regulator [unclassified Mesorhizobium]MBZ9746557.1 helix-turn-helix transcriptional regulator [Mesorhizobium sp. CO1-1-7]MBZ9756279.1 helix-turn-helix transcriptional regulator [Mesorhizobium sp. ESP6-5]
MSRKTVLSSARLPPHLDERERFSPWQDIPVAEIRSAEYDSPENLHFEAIEATAVGSAVLGQMSGPVKHATRKASNIANDDEDGYLLMINKADTMLSGVHAGREYAVGRGEAVLVTASEALKMNGADSNVWTNVVVPRAILLRAFPQIDDRLGLKIGADSEALELLKRYCLLLESGSPLASADLITHATDTIVDLIGLATGAKGRAAELAGLRGLRAARLEAVLARIAEDFIDPGISAQSVALQLGLSVRYVHDLLQETGMSFSERVLELRLQSAHRMLSHKHSDMRVSDIALTSGFSDVSYFNRCFRRRFGYTPTSAR